MQSKWTIGKKLYLAFISVALITLVLGVISFVSSVSLVKTAGEANQRLADARHVGEVATATIAQYQNQADLIINQDLNALPEFEKSAAEFANLLTQLDQIVDTEEEKAWAKKVHEADERFDKTFKEGVVPEVKYILEEHLKQLDGQSDELIGKAEEVMQKIALSLDAEFQEALKSKDSAAITKRANDVLAAERALFWLNKQYQNQADLIINQNLKAAEDFEATAAKMDEQREIVGAAVDTPEEVALYKEFKEIDATYDSLFNEQVIPAVKRQLEKRIQQYDAESDVAIAEVVENVEKIAVSLTDEAREATTAYEATAARAQMLSIIVSVVAVVLALFLGIVITRGINTALRRLAADLGSGAEQTASASAQVAQSSQAMAEGASEQASSLEETSASLEQMTSMTKQNAQNATHATTLMAQSKDVVAAMAKATQEMSEAISEIKASSDQTAKIIKTIDEIAFQTNLLALNAAVEAARAGDAGKGFAVVAEEVRNLAQRSAEAAKNTASMIEGSVKSAANGVQVTERVADALKQTVDNAGKVAQLVDEIAAATNEQAQGIDQINAAVAQMDKVTQSNAANSEESASASEELSAQAQEMRRMVKDLLALVGGDETSTEPSSQVIRHHQPARRVIQTERVNVPERRAKLPTSAPGTHAVIKPEQVIPFDDDDLKNF
mgnify:CR=1 FL=1